MMNLRKIVLASAASAALLGLAAPAVAASATTTHVTVTGRYLREASTPRWFASAGPDLGSYVYIKHKSDASKLAFVLVSGHHPAGVLRLTGRTNRCLGVGTNRWVFTTVKRCSGDTAILWETKTINGKTYFVNLAASSHFGGSPEYLAAQATYGSRLVVTNNQTHFHFRWVWVTP